MLVKNKKQKMKKKNNNGLQRKQKGTDVDK